SSISFVMSFFTPRICCCSATVASRVVAVLAIVVNGISAIVGFIGAIWVASLVQTILAMVEIVAAVLVFVACAKQKPALMIPILVMQ
ncbi:hypothetical protein PFISCL1PPCAC_28797, partial [Pristionchus fissidentatus]